jgi:hypothetical protein
MNKLWRSTGVVKTLEPNWAERLVHAFQQDKLLIQIKTAGRLTDLAQVQVI